MKINNILETIGNTPVVKLDSIFQGPSEVWMKLERFNPGGSIKDRIALAMIEDAEAAGIINKDTVIIEPTSGNTGIGLSMVAAVKGYKLIIVMPESMSIERRKLMLAYGAELVLTPKELGTVGAIEKAKTLTQETPNSWMPNQFNNPSNPQAHEKYTVKEIIKDFPEGIDYLITGVGSGGHITGISKKLKEKFPNLKVFAVEPEASPVLSGGVPGPHPIQGIGAGFIPEILQQDLIDEVIKVNSDEAYTYTRKLARKEGILGGVSTGASLAAIAKVIKDLPENSQVLSLNYDTGERYTSVPDLF